MYKYRILHKLLVDINFYITGLRNDFERMWTSHLALFPIASCLSRLSYILKQALLCYIPISSKHILIFSCSDASLITTVSYFTLSRFSKLIFSTSLKLVLLGELWIYGLFKFLVSNRYTQAHHFKFKFCAFSWLSWYTKSINFRAQ